MTEDALATDFSGLDSDWMPCPKIDIEFPALAYLVPLDNLIIVTKPDRHLQLLSEGKGCFTVFNKQGQKVFLAVREAQKCDVKIFNIYGNIVLELVLPFADFQQEASIFCPPGNQVGVIQEKLKSTTENVFLVTSPEDDWGMEIKAKEESLDYDILFEDVTVGVIKASWIAVVNVDSFGVTFPVDMEVGKKAVLLGASFMIACLKYDSASEQ